MHFFTSRLPPLQAYVAGVICLGVLCCVGVFALDSDGLSRLLTPEVLLFAACAFAGELISLKVVTRGSEGEVTTSTTFAFAALLVAGPACALVALITASFAADTIQRKGPQRLLFNASQYVITLTASALVLHALTGVPRLGDEFHFAPGDLPGILVAATVFFLVNSSLVAVVIALVQGIRVGKYLVQDWFFQVSTGGLMLGLAPMVALAADFSLPSVALLFLPLLAVHRGGRQAIAKEHQAVHDALTGLPNRLLFSHRIEQVVNAGRRSEGTSAVMLIDLDHFKEINDTLGHHAGDRLLQEVAVRLRASLDEQDTVSRLGGDHLVLVERVAQPLGDLLQETVAGMVAERVVDLLEVIEVDQHDGRRTIRAAAGVDDLLDLVPEERPVRQPCQRVVDGLVLLGDRLPAASVDGEQWQEQQRHRWQGEVGGEGDHRREAEHEAAGRDLEEPVLDEVAADPDVLHEGDDDGHQRRVDEEERGGGHEDPRQVGGSEVELLPAARDVGERLQHERARGERDHVLRGVEEELERRLALDEVGGEAGADQRHDRAGGTGDQQRGEREGGRGGDLALRSARDDLQ